MSDAQTTQHTSPTQVHRSPAPAHQAVRNVNFARVVRSEWIKFTTLRSTLWIIALTIVVMVGLSAMMAWGMTFEAQDPAMAGGGQGDPQPAPADPPGGLGLIAVTFSYSVGQIVVVVLGVLIATSEYATGQIRSTLSAVPSRLPVLVAKVLVTAVSAFILGAVAVALCYLATQAIISGHDLDIDLSAEGAMQSVLGVPLYLLAIALFGLAIGFLLRHTAGAISLVLGVLLVLPMISMIGLDWVQELSHYLPAAAGERLIMGEMPGAVLSPWEGYAVLGGYVVVLLTAAGVLLRRRDA
ncbi:MAG TPA: ABC transporter permease subunit [Beutenbergiaceae bacterium]|nr:ABC transporter permease subunit [Beutenbergiaceae bacterium]